MGRKPPELRYFRQGGKWYYLWDGHRLYDARTAEKQWLEMSGLTEKNVDVYTRDGTMVEMSRHDMPPHVLEYEIKLNGP